MDSCKYMSQSELADKLCDAHKELVVMLLDVRDNPLTENLSKIPSYYHNICKLLSQLEVLEHEIFTASGVGSKQRKQYELIKKRLYSNHVIKNNDIRKTIDDINRDMSELKRNNYKLERLIKGATRFQMNRGRIAEELRGIINEIEWKDNEIEWKDKKIESNDKKIESKNKKILCENKQIDDLTTINDRIKLIEKLSSDIKKYIEDMRNIYTKTVHQINDILKREQSSNDGTRHSYDVEKNDIIIELDNTIAHETKTIDRLSQKKKEYTELIKRKRARNHKTVKELELDQCIEKIIVKYSDLDRFSEEKDQEDKDQEDKDYEEKAKAPEQAEVSDEVFQQVQEWKVQSDQNPELKNYSEQNRNENAYASFLARCLFEKVIVENQKTNRKTSDSCSRQQAVKRRKSYSIRKVLSDTMKIGTIEYRGTLNRAYDRENR